MDSNNSQMAISPCQIGTIHRNINRLHSRQRKLIIPVWCTYDATKTVVIRGDDHWLGARDLEGDLIIEPGSTLRISCRLSFPRSAKLVVSPGAKLILDDCQLHNACGDQWEGIEILEKGEEAGEVQYIGDPEISDVRESRHY